MAAEPALPIFRSRAQERLLTELFVLAADPRSLTDLGRRTGIPVSSVQREIESLERAGIVTSTRVGQTRLVAPDRSSRFYGDLVSLLTKAFGPETILRDLLRSVAGVREAYVFGSWARRYGGEPGAPPADIDLVVIGEPAVAEVNRAAREAEESLGLEVNPLVVSPAEWAAAEGFLRRVRDGSLVAVVP